MMLQHNSPWENLFVANWAVKLRLLWQSAIAGIHNFFTVFPTIFLKWSAFGILLPLALLIIQYYETDTTSSLLRFLLEEREILIIAVVLCGEALGEVLTASDKIPELIRLATGIGAFILTVFSCFVYGDLAPPMLLA